ncbi:LamG-like jellyroll fold domain-containing protein, partial [Planctomycetota bacterium]
MRTFVVQGFSRHALAIGLVGLLLAVVPLAGAGVVKYDYDAANDTTGDNTWESEIAAASNRDWTLDKNPSAPISVTSAHVGITKAYDFGGGLTTDPTTGTTGAFAGSDIDANGPVALEFWLKPDDLSGSEVIFESGGGTHGAAMLLVGSSLEYRTRNTNVNVDATHTLSAGDLTDFVQVVGVTDLANNDTRIYVNGLLSQAMPGRKDWTTGSNASGLAAANSDIGAVGSAAGWGKFQGQIARARFYRGELSPTQVNATYNEIVTGPASDAYSAAVLADAPIVYYRLDDPTGSISAYNRGSLGLDATGAYVNTPNPQATGLLPGHTNPATSLDGSGDQDYISLPSHTAINTAAAGYTNKTIELWFDADDASGFGTGSRQVLYEQGGSGNGLNVYTEGRRVYAGAWDSTTRKWVSTGIGSGMTHHLALTYDNGQLIGYLDGQIFDTATGAANIPTHTGKNAIGAVSNDTYYQSGTGASTTNVSHFAGTIDEVALYNTTLSQADVRAHLAAAGATLGIVRENLVLNYDAADTASTDTLWRNIGGTPGSTAADFTLTGATRATGVSSHPGLAAAYAFTGTGSGGTWPGSTSADSIHDVLGDARTDRAASFEIWLTPATSRAATSSSRAAAAPTAAASSSTAPSSASPHATAPTPPTAPCSRASSISPPCPPSSSATSSRSSASSTPAPTTPSSTS